MMKSFLRFYPFFPFVGLCFFVVLFVLAALDFPGGSFNYPHATGYSFFNNFLCDVMEPVTKGGLPNPARSLAVFSHLVLSATMVMFFYMLPEIVEKRNWRFYTTRYVGVLTMTVFAFMYTPYHDDIVTITGVLGSIALVPFFIELRAYPNNGLKRFAYLCFAMSLVVFFIFETKIGFYYLPFLQKIAFLIDATWVLWVGIVVYQKNRVVYSYHP